MTTRAEELTETERWSAWGEQESLLLPVQGKTPRPVYLSRWDVHTLLAGATEAAFTGSDTGGGAAQMQQVHVSAPGAGAPRLEELRVQKPADAGAWVAELRSLPSVGARFYQVGPWILRVEAPSYYARVHGATTPDEAERLRRSAPFGESYGAMFRHASSGADRTGAVWALLRGTAAWDVPPAMAQLAVAMCVSEAVRNWRTWGINLMLLDLLQNNLVSWSDLFEHELHPMARGGTFDQEAAKTGMKGGRASSATWSLETSITMTWLRTSSGLTADGSALEPRRIPGREQPWRDPAKEQAHLGSVRRRVMGALLQRFRHL